MDKIFWVDLEMTGLDPASCRIIELAAIVTDLEFNPVATYHSVVFQPPSFLEAMDEWNTKTHGESGLTALVPSGKPLADVETDVIALIKTHFPGSKPILAGNSIHQDRRFIDLYMPLLSQCLHYRLLDVSAIKLVFRHFFGVEFTKNGGHRAHDDIKESIRELQYYLNYIKSHKS